MPTLIRDYSRKTQWYTNYAGPNGTDIRDVTDRLPPDDRWTSSIYIELRDGVRPGWDSTANERVQLQHERIMQYNVAYWWEWWEYVDPTWPNITPYWQIMWQLHYASGGTQPPICTEMYGLQRRQRYTPDGVNHQWPWYGEAYKGQWVHYRLGFKLNTGTGGFLTLYQNETKVLDRQGIKTAPNTESVYACLGIYRPTSGNGTAKYWVSGMQVWDGDPGYPGGGGGEPPPPPPVLGSPPHSAGERIGRISSGSWNTLNASRIRGSVFSVTSPARLKAMVAPIRGRGGTGSQPTSAAVYRVVNPSDPGSDVFMGETEVLTFQQDQVPVYAVWDFDAPGLDLTQAADYRFCILSGDNAVLEYGITTPNASLSYGPITWPGAPSTLGGEGAILDDLQTGVDIYAWYEPLVVAGSAKFSQQDFDEIMFRAVAGTGAPGEETIPPAEIEFIPHGPVRMTQRSRPSWKGVWLTFDSGLGRYIKDSDQTDWTDESEETP